MRYFMTVILGLFLGLTISAQDIETYSPNSSMTVSNDKNIIAIAGRISEDSSIRSPIDFYDVATGNLISSFRDNEDPIIGLTLNSNGSLLAYSTNGGRLAVVDVQTGVELSVIVEGGSMELGYPRWSPDDSLLAFFTGRAIAIHNATDYHSYASLVEEDNLGNVGGFSWDPTSTYIVATMNNANGRSISVWEIVSPNEISLEKIIDASVGSVVSWHPRLDSIATNQRGGILILEIENGDQRILATSKSDEPIYSVAWSPDGEKVAGGGNGIVYIWDVQTGAINEIIEIDDRANDIFWSIDGQFVYHTGGVAGIYRNGIPLQEIADQ